MRNFLKSKKLNFLSLLLTGLMVLSFSSINVSAETKNPNQMLVNTYLTALKNQDISTIVNISIDNRVKDKLNYQVWLEQMLNNPNQQISKFTVLDEDKNFDEYSIISAEIEFLNGDVVKVPFRVQNEIVYIDKLDNLTKIQTGVEIPYSEPSPMSQVVSWYTTLSLAPNYPDTQYTSSFSYSSNYTTLNFRQYTSSSAPVAAKVEYAVVKKGIFSDTVYASQVVSGDNSSSAKQITLTLGSGQTFNGFCIRIDNYNYSYSTTAFGEAYCY